MSLFAVSMYHIVSIVSMYYIVYVDKDVGLKRFIFGDSSQRVKTITVGP